MEHHPLRLDAGTRVLVVGSTPNDHRWLMTPKDEGPEPWIVLAGALLEPYVPGSGLLMAPGPTSGSIAARGIVAVRFAEHHEGQKVVELERGMPDENGAMRYVLVEDREDIGGMLSRELNAWPQPLAAAAHIKRLVKMAYGWASPWHLAWQAAR